MPSTICNTSGCNRLIPCGQGGLCTACSKQKQREHNALPERKNQRRFYASTKWRRLREDLLKESPLCLHCYQAGRTTLATEVDHIVPRSADPSRELDYTNLQALCKPCHSRKTVSENWNKDKGDKDIR